MLRINGLISVNRVERAFEEPEVKEQFHFDQTSHLLAKRTKSWWNADEEITVLVAQYEALKERMNCRVFLMTSTLTTTPSWPIA